MACVPLTSLMNTIQFEFLQATPPVILDEHTTHITNSLYQNLGFLLACPQELVKKSGIDPAALKDLEAEITDFAFSAEDEIESNLTNIYMAAADKEMILCQNLQQVAEDAEVILFQNLQQVAEDTQVFVNRIKSQYYDSAVQGVPKLVSDHESDSLGGSSQQHSKIGGRMVGRRSELSTIMDQLTRHPSEQRKVISVFGMGGIGKTTLAKRVYEDPLVISHFDVRAWATVSQQVNVKHILSDLLWSLRSEMDINGSTDDLAHKLRQCLMGTRYLIVLDDVWETSVWDFLATCFLNSYAGGAVLVTTRLKEIADYTASGTNLHKLHFLDSNESWDLFCNNILFKEPLPPKFETIGRNIVKKCRGLPLAIVVAAGLLSKLNKAELENIEDEISYVVGKDIGSRILTLSYNHLPQHLKACFLYLGVFSANSEIRVKKLVRLWIAHGFVTSSRDKKVEEVGVEYLQDLISRSLVVIDKLKSNGQIKTCRMHDLLNGLCVRQATNENLLFAEDNGFDMCNSTKKAHGVRGWLSCFRSSKPKHFDICNTSKNACGSYRWLSFRSSNSELFDLCNTSNNARSILCLHKEEMPMVNDPKPVKFNLLVVLDLTSPLYTKGVYVSYQDLSNLVLLRYLDFMFDRSPGFEGLKTALSKNQKLQTLIVSHSVATHGQAHFSCLPSTVWGSPQLRHLEFRNFFRVEPPSIVKENLQSLYWLSIFHCTKEVFSMIPNIKMLGIFCESRLNPDDGVSCKDDPHNLENLCYLNQLEVLTIEVEYAIPKSVFLPSIDAFPRNLRKLKLSKTYLPWKDIATIALLPVLEVLKLKMDAFYGLGWKPTEGGFHRLKFLLLENVDLRIWNAFDDEFPILERLVLKHCESLMEIPSVFSYINSLQSIELERCHPALFACAKSIKEEHLDLGNDGLVVIDHTPQYTYEQHMSWNYRHRRTKTHF